MSSSINQGAIDGINVKPIWGNVIGNGSADGEDNFEAILQQLTTYLDAKADKIDVYKKTETYSRDELDALFAGKSNSSHIHDDRYYTETEVDTLLDGKVNRSGDTMTGNLTIKNMDLDNTDQSRANTTERDFILTDKNNKVVGYFGNIMAPNGLINTYIGGRRFNGGTEVSNYLYLKIDKDFNKTVEVSDPSAWRSAIGVTDAIKSISRSGTTFTATRLDGSTFTFTQQDNNTTYNFSGTTFYSGNSNTADHDANSIVKNGHYYYTSNGPATSLGASTNDGALYSQSYSDVWVAQIAQDYRNGNLFTRGKNNGTWQSWKAVSYNGHTHTSLVDPGNANYNLGLKWSGEATTASYICVWQPLSGYTQVIQAMSPSNLRTVIGAAASSHTHNYAGSSSAGGAATSLANFENNNNSGKNANNVTYNGITYYNSNGPATSIGANANDGALYCQAWSTNWVAQIAQDYRNGNLFTRGKNNGTWQSWKAVSYYTMGTAALTPGSSALATGSVYYQYE